MPKGGGRQTTKGTGFKNAAVKASGGAKAPSAKATKGTSKGGLPAGLKKSR